MPDPERCGELGPWSKTAGCDREAGHDGSHRIIETGVIEYSRGRTLWSSQDHWDNEAPDREHSCVLARVVEKMRARIRVLHEMRFFCEACSAAPGEACGDGSESCPAGSRRANAISHGFVDG